MSGVDCLWSFLHIFLLSNCAFISFKWSLFLDALELFKVCSNWSASVYVQRLPRCIDAMSRVSAWHVHGSSSFEFFTLIGPFSDYGSFYSGIAMSY